MNKSITKYEQYRKEIDSFPKGDSTYFLKYFGDVWKECANKNCSGQYNSCHQDHSNGYRENSDPKKPFCPIYEKMLLVVRNKQSTL